jgi:sodium transport system permease protein
MNSPTSIVADKEITEAARDRRSLASSLLYALMGPIIVGLLTFTGTSAATEPSTLLALSSLFLILSAFTGGMNIAMDTLAGERERKSLLPLVMNPISRLQLIAGKWISVGAFSVVALFLNCIAFAFIIGHVLPARFAELARLPVVACLLLAMIPLAMLAAAAELAVSTICRSVKEAHTWLAFLVFVPVGLGLFLVFHPNFFGEWSYAVPVLGQQVLLSRMVAGTMPSFSQAFVLCVVSIVATISLLRTTSKILQRDDVLYGN